MYYPGNTVKSPGKERGAGKRAGRSITRPGQVSLSKAGCERLFTDKASGAKVDRPGLAEALQFARADDCMVVWKLDRLGRSIQGLIALAADLAARRVDFRSLTDGFDTSTPSGRLLFHILASVAEMERELIKERTIAGLAAARMKGGIGSGRKSALTPDKLDTARKLLAAGDKPAKVAKLLQVGLSTFYRHFPASERETIGSGGQQPPQKTIA